MPMSSTTRPLAISTVQIDNPRVRVTEWRFPPGTSTGFHRHAYDYVVVPMTTARLRILAPTGELAGDLVLGQAYFRSAGAEHEVVNDNPFEVVFVETELKQTSPA
jgi:quercetin dioxygenase-like cupin family protein